MGPVAAAGEVMGWLWSLVGRKNPVAPAADHGMDAINNYFSTVLPFSVLDLCSHLSATFLRMTRVAEAISWQLAQRARNLLES